MAFGQLSLKGRALRLLAAREYSRAELVRKLAQFEEAPGQLEKALDELQGKGFIDEQRVADSVVHRRASRVGAARIRQELVGKGLAPEMVAEAVAGLKETELERAREVWLKKFGALPADAAQRARQGRFLMARGFSPAVISRVFRQSGDGEA
jgi:regulatory protein